MHIDYLTINFGRINNLPVMRMETPTGRLIISHDTVLGIFNLEHCVNRLVTSLSAITGDVDRKLARLKEIVSTVTESAKVMDTIHEEFLDRNDIVGCELIALLLGESS